MYANPNTPRLRRTEISAFHPVSRRSGVITSDSVRKIRPSRPVVRIAKLTSLTPSWPRYASHTSRMAGTRPHAMTSFFANFPSKIGSGLMLGTARSEVRTEIHPGVEARDLLGIAVERQRLASAALADPALGCLAPPRMRMVGVHVRVEAVLGGRVPAPARRGFLVG